MRYIVASLLKDQLRLRPFGLSNLYYETVLFSEATYTDEDYVLRSLRKYDSLNLHPMICSQHNRLFMFLGEFSVCSKNNHEGRRDHSGGE